MPSTPWERVLLDAAHTECPGCDFESVRSDFFVLAVTSNGSLILEPAALSREFGDGLAVVCPMCAVKLGSLVPSALRHCLGVINGMRAAS